MKRTLLAVLSLFVTMGVMAATGNILFQNKVAATATPNGAAITAPVYLVGTTTPVAANEYVAELWWSATVGGSLAPATTADGKIVQSIITGSTGFFAGGAKEIAGSTAGAPADFQVRVYKPFAQPVPGTVSLWNGATYWGKSETLTLSLTAPPNTPMPMMGLSTIYVEPVPEPSILALGLLGMGAFMLRRRS